MTIVHTFNRPKRENKMTLQKNILQEPWHPQEDYMKKIAFMINLCVCILFITIPGIGCAQPIKVKIPCSPPHLSRAEIQTRWKEVRNGNPNIRFSLTTVGIQVAGEEELVTIWDDMEKGIFRSAIDGQGPDILAECTPSRKRMEMFPIGGFAPGNGPTLVCKPGEGITMIMLSPNDPDPKKYIYHAILNRDEMNPSSVNVADISHGIRVDLPPDFEHKVS